MRYGVKRRRRLAAAMAEALEGRVMLAAGDFDPGFGGGDGAVTAGFSGFSFTHDTGEAMAVRPDGRIVLVGRSGDGSNTQDRVAVAQFDESGALDPAFNGDGDADGLILQAPGGADYDAGAVALQADGKIVIVGSTSFGVARANTTDWFVMRLNENGSIDDTFGGGDGLVTLDFGFDFTDTANAVAIQGDGKIVVTGVATQSTSNMATVRFNTDGTLDDNSDGSGFSGDGIDTVDFFGAVDFASDVIVDPDGKIVVVGGSVPQGDHRRFTLLRYTTAGVLDPTFDGDGKASTDFGAGNSAFAQQVLRQPDGTYVVGGTVGASSIAPYGIARYTAGGALDPTFGTNAALPGTTLVPSVTGHIFEAYGIARQADGKLLLGGFSEVDSPNFATYLTAVRFTTAGALDTTFGSGGIRQVSVPGTTEGFGAGADVAIAKGGQVLIGGEAYLNGQKDFALVRLKSVDTVTPGGVTLNGNVLTVVGTESDDVLTLSATATTFTAVLNGTTFTFPAASVASLNVDLKGGNDTENHNGNVPGGSVTLGSGNDALTVGTGNKTTPVLTVNGGDGNDMVTLGVAFFTPTSFTGGPGNDTLTYNGSQGDDDFLVTPTQITNEGFDAATYATVETVNVLGNFSDDQFTLRGTATGTSYRLDGGPGDDHFLISNPADPDGFTMPVTLVGGDNADEIVFDDSGDDFDDDYAITPTTFARDFLGTTFNYQSTETLRVVSGIAPNDFVVTPSATTAVFVSAGDPTSGMGDTITVPLGGVNNPTYTLLGTGSARYTFAGFGPVEFAGIEKDLTAFGPSVTAASFDYRPPKQMINFTFSEDVMGSLELNDIVVRNTDTGQAVNPAKFVLSESGGAWIPTTARLELNQVLADGNYTVTLSGAGITDAAGNALGADYVLKFFVMGGDANRDGRVDFADLVLLAQNYNSPTGKTWSEGDFNGDGGVDFNDLVLLAQRYNTMVLRPAAAATAMRVQGAAVTAPPRVVKPVFSTKAVVKPVKVASKPAKVAGRGVRRV